MESNRFNTTQTQSSVSTYDAGLRAHFRRVYNMMSVGLVVTGLVAWFTSQSPELFAQVHGTWLGIVIALAPLGIVFFGLTPRKIMTMNMGTAYGLYFALTALIGLSMSYIFVMYTGESVARVFFITAAMFAGMSIWGYTTKKDLSSLGSFLMMGVIGLIIASIVNMFFASSMMSFVISVAGVGIFTLLVAFDTQAIKETYNPAHGDHVNNRLAVMGALSLYINAINLFQFLLALLGNRQ